MTFKTLLTVTGPGEGDGDLALAAELAGQAGAHLSVLVVAMAAPPPIGHFGAMLSEAWLEERQADMRRLDERRKAVSAFFAGRDLSVDIVDEYREMSWIDDAIGRRARYCDLTLIGPELARDGLLKDKVWEGALFSSARPLLVLPAGASATLQPKRVTVAWNSSLEATRAVRESLDLLVGAEAVRLALVDPVEGDYGQGAEPGADIATHLARHGVKVTVDRLPGEGRPVADVLARHARDTGAEMIVMGAYGHSRLRERMLGGVTRSLLAEPPLPLFLAR